MDMQQGNYYEVTSGMDGLKNAGDQSAFNTALASASYTDATGSDYLTNLRMYFYIRAFAGVGFDVSVVAFKIGVFGQLNLDMQYKSGGKLEYQRRGAGQQPDGRRYTGLQPVCQRLHRH